MLTSHISRSALEIAPVSAFMNIHLCEDNYKSCLVFIITIIILFAVKQSRLYLGCGVDRTFRVDQNKFSRTQDGAHPAF